MNHLILLILLVSCLSVSGFCPSLRMKSKTTSLQSNNAPDVSILPKLIVFDLDNTLWTPELYQIRKRPKVNEDIRLFPDAPEIIRWLSSRDVQLAIASRTSKTNWAKELLQEFTVDSVEIEDYFQAIEIYPGSKKTHFEALKQQTGYKFSEMLFFDDDARMNLEEISRMGVLCCHTPRGITLKHFVASLQKYEELMKGHSNDHWMGYILNAKTLGLGDDVPHIDTKEGVVKFYSSEKRFGFIADQQGNEYFVHESKLPYGVSVHTGDKVQFEAMKDSRGRNAAVVLSVESNVEKESMKCFTMSQPFAALLLNGVKSVESRNNDMFKDIKPGTKLLLHIGQRDWHDTKSFREILRAEGMSDTEIDKASRLRKGFRKGEIAGVVTVGDTWDASAEKTSKSLQRRVLAPPDGIGRFCTEIIDSRWLTKPFKMRGKPGLYEADVPIDIIPTVSQ